MSSRNRINQSPVQMTDDSPENAELDEAFSKLNMYLFATQNKLVQKILVSNLDVLAKEAIKRDSSLTFKLKQYILTLKQMIKQENK